MPDYPGLDDAFARWQAHTNEVELWLAMLVARYGVDMGRKGYQLQIPGEEALALREALPRRAPIVIVGALDGGWVLDVL